MDYTRAQLDARGGEAMSRTSAAATHNITTGLRNGAGPHDPALRATVSW
jgi:hypothetical protein